MSMSITVLSTPNQTLDLTGQHGDTAVAYGDGDIIDSGKSNYATNTLSGSNNTIYLSGPNETFISGSGYDAGHDQVAVYGDGDTVKISNGNVTTFGHGETVNAFDFGKADAFFPLGQVNVAAQGDSSVFFTGAGAGISFIGGSGFSVVLGGTATRTEINGGQGGGVFVGGENSQEISPGTLWSASNTIVAGAQKSTLYGSNHGNNTLIAVGNAGDGLVGGENAVNVLTAAGSTGNNYMEAHQGAYAPSTDFKNPTPSTVMTGGAGNDAMVAGSGYNEMHAGTGVDTFLVINSAINQVGGGNQIMIDSFKQGTDHVDLVGYSGSTDMLLSTAQHANGGTQLQLSDGAHLNVAGVNLTSNDIWRQ